VDHTFNEVFFTAYCVLLHCSSNNNIADVKADASTQQNGGSAANSPRLPLDENKVTFQSGDDDMLFAAALYKVKLLGLLEKAEDRELVGFREIFVSYPN